jgi:hypothetical protein
MQELIAKANEAILESQCLRSEGRSLRIEASMLASRLGQTVMRSARTEQETCRLRESIDHALSDP